MRSRARGHVLGKMSNGYFFFYLDSSRRKRSRNSKDVYCCGAYINSLFHWEQLLDFNLLIRAAPLGTTEQSALRAYFLFVIKTLFIIYSAKSEGYIVDGNFSVVEVNGWFCSCSSIPFVGFSFPSLENLVGRRNIYYG